jgi:hypothetical protein
MQTRVSSAIESAINLAAGMAVSIAIQLVVYPVLDIPVTFGQNIIITSVFTVASLLRSYIIRRIFNARKSGIKKLRTPPRQFLAKGAALRR